MRKRNVVLLAILLAVIAAVIAAVAAAYVDSKSYDSTIIVSQDSKSYDSAIIVSQDNMEALFSALGEEWSQEQRNWCFEITPKAVSDATEWRLFTMQSQYSFLLADGEAYTLCGYWGGWGVTSAVPWDYDGNGVMDLLYTYSWGSGIHRSHVAVFDMTARQEVTLTAVYAQHDEDAVVLPPEPDAPERFPVHLTDAIYSFEGPTRFSLKEQIGVVTLQDRQPIYSGQQESFEVN